MPKRMNRLGKGKLPNPETCYLRYIAAADALKELRDRHEGVTAEFKTMRGLPNEIARVGGLADGLGQAIDVLDAALRIYKPSRPKRRVA